MKLKLALVVAMGSAKRVVVVLVSGMGDGVIVVATSVDKWGVDCSLVKRIPMVMTKDKLAKREIMKPRLKDFGWVWVGAGGLNMSLV